MPSFPSLPVLLVDDEAHSRLGMSMALRSSGIDNLIECASPTTVMASVRDKRPCVALLDLIMPEMNGTELLKAIAKDYPETAVIIVSGQNEIELAVSCMKQGASDYLTKPFNRETLVKAVRRAIELAELRGENTLMRDQLLKPSSLRDPAFADIITASAKMEAIFKYCVAIAPGRQPVMITGETGCGKELVSKAMHKLSGRKGRFVAVNLAGLDSNVFSDTLFGHVKGAFTGADAKRNGLVEEACGGTLLLDEIGELSEEAQVKLLRLLQEREYSPLGSDELKTSNARILVATNRDLEAEVEKGKFRRDLFFRLKIHQVRIPSLRERPEDLRPLLEHFAAEAAAEFGKETPSIHSSLVEALKTYPFKGNVRELRAMAYDAVGLCQERTLTCADMKVDSQAKPKCEAGLASNGSLQTQDGAFNFPETLPSLKEMGMMLVSEALRRSAGNQSAAARLLGVTQQALNKRMRKNNHQDDEE